MNAQTKKSGTDKMSQSGKVAKRPYPKKGKVLRLVALVLLVLLILSGLVTTVIWLNRTSVAENQIRKFMSKNGYDVALDVQRLSKKQITIANIIVSKNNDVFFKSARVVVDYDLSTRKAHRVELLKPYLKVAFDTKGTITSVWMQQSTGRTGGRTGGSTDKFILPPKGVRIKDATIDWRLMQGKDTVLGTGQANVSADIISDIDWNAKITDAQAAFNTDTLTGNIEQDVSIETKDGKSFDVFGSVNGQNLSTSLPPFEDFRTQSAKSEFKFTFIRAKENQRPTLFGWAEARIKKLATQDYSVETVDLKLEQLRLNADGGISTNWQIKTNETRVKNNDMRADLANKLTAHDVMANIPIAQHFTKALYNKAEQLLDGFATDGQGSFAASGTGYAVHLQRPLDLTSTEQKIRFTQKAGAFIQYIQLDKRIAVKADINWSGVQALQLSNFAMTAKSTNGLKLDAVNNMRARMRSQRTWRQQSGGGAIRLAPFDIDFTYTDQGNAVRTVNIKGGIDYAGPVPGGTVLGMKADGKMDVRLQGQDFALGYSPSGPLYIGEFTNPSGWTSKSLKFNLEPQANLLRKTATSGVMQMKLKSISTQLVGPEDTRHLDARFKRMDITTDFAHTPQRWQIRVSGTDIKSEDFPAPGTHITSPSAQLEVLQSRGGNLTFNILSPETSITTDNAVIEDLHINLNGSPDDIALKYNAGSVTMVGGGVPVLPMHGTARLKSGELTGQATTNLPHTQDTPIDIQYRSKNGQGSAEILIPKIVFDPKGLQPQQLVPLLRGKLAEVSGEVSAEFLFTFGGGQAVRSSGRAELKNLDVGTLVGPITGINSQLRFASIFPLKTEGIQAATMAEFDPGFPLKTGSVQFEIIPDGVKLHQAQWPINNIKGADGKIFLTPMDWQFGNVENLVTVNVENVGLGTMLAGIGKGKFTATGQVFGMLPAKIEGVDVLIQEGVLAVKDGGVIRYKSTATDAAAARNENASHAFKALENFQYKQLEARIDGPLDGEMALKIVFDGQNPEVLSGQPFQFNTVVSGELATIARNLAGAFSNEENLSRIIEVQKNKQADTP